MEENPLSQESVNALTAQLGTILDSTYSTEDISTLTEEGRTYHAIRIRLIPSKAPPTGMLPSLLASAQKKSMPLDPSLAVDQSLAIDQNRELAALLSKYIQPELEANPDLRIVEAGTIKRSEMGGNFYDLTTLDRGENGENIALRVAASPQHSDNGSIIIKIDYDDTNPIPNANTVAALRSVLVSAFEKAAPEFLKVRAKHDTIFKNAPPLPPSPPQQGR